MKNIKNLTVKDKIDGDLSNQIKILTNSVVDLYTPGEISGQTSGKQ